jgi:putative sigma-54 modulation protein
MQFSLTFRKMDATDAIKQYVEEKVKKIKRFFPDPINAHVVLSLERYKHRADLNITLHNGLLLKGQESSDDMYSSIDQAVAKIEKQVRRYKDKIRSHKPNTGPELPYRLDVIEDGGPAEAAASAAVDGESLADARQRIIRSESFTARTMTVDEAVMQMNLMNNAFLVFTNSESRAINVLYRRNDGHYGLIDTAQQA